MPRFDIRSLLRKKTTSQRVALDLIEETRRVGATSLDLTGPGLKAMPPEIGNLTNLKRLNLRYTPSQGERGPSRSRRYGRTPG